MRRLPTLELLDVWERGLVASSMQRALLLLSSVLPDRSFEELSRLQIGERDTLLLEIYEKAFGPILTCETACPECGERLELNLRSDELKAPRPGPLQASAELNAEGYNVIFRLPDSLDLNAASLCHDLTFAWQVLVDCCILKAQRDGKECNASELPGTVIDAVSSRMEEMDPQANIQIDLTCPSCGNRWFRPFDILPLLWTEIDITARRTLREVHLLALAYGWGETEILTMSQWRRQAYLEMIGS